MSSTPRRRDLQRNAAFFLGAFGTALGVMGGVLSALGIAAALVPDFAETAPDWVFMLAIIVLLVSVIGAWPALDWITANRPDLGGPLMAVVGLVFIVVGAVAVLATAWGLTGWLSLAGGGLLMVASYLTIAGGGLEPLTWASLRTRRVQAIEVHLDRAVGAVFVLVVVAALLVWVVDASGSGWPIAAVLGALVLIAGGWLALITLGPRKQSRRRPRRR